MPDILNSSHGGDIPDLRSSTSDTGTGTYFQNLYESTNNLAEPFLAALAFTMVDLNPPRDDQRVNPAYSAKATKLFAGYTYLGQFIDHDLTHDKTNFTRSTTIGRSRNLRTPSFDLDSLYGEGPESGADAKLYDGPKLRLGKNQVDLCRPDGMKSEIRDQRNDSNLIVSQIHAAFCRFHNRVIDQRNLGSTPAEIFKRARDIVTRHYQWIVLHDFLPTIVGIDVASEYMKQGSSFRMYRPESRTFMPREFSGAAFRFGHSMVRKFYQLRSPNHLVLTFNATEIAESESDDLRGFRALRQRDIIDWDLFFPPPGGASARTQLASPINTLIAEPLASLPFSVTNDRAPQGRSLAYRNLVRSEQNLKLISGQELAKIALIPPDDILGQGRPFDFSMARWGSSGNVGGTGLTRDELVEKVSAQTPLWYYILAEAWEFYRGEQLGPLGGRIVAEVLVGLMLEDSKSILNGNNNWRPVRDECGCKNDGHYAMNELLKYVDVNN